jgi:hypothetical protein
MRVAKQPCDVTYMQQTGNTPAMPRVWSDMVQIQNCHPHLGRD